MTDTPSPPRNSVARFGVSFVGPTFIWTWAEPAEDGSGELVVKEKEFRAHPGLSFEEQLEYTRSLTMLQATAVMDQNKMQGVVDAITKTPEGEDPMPALNKLADDVTASESQRWAMQIDQVCMLVNPAERDEFRPLVSAGNPADVRALKEHLVEVVINRTIKTVEVVGGVDPTSLASSAG